MPIKIWSTTAADNDDADSASGVVYTEGQAPGTLNNSARAMMAVLKRCFDDTKGATVAGGTASAMTLAADPAITAYVAGDHFMFRAVGPNTITGPTLNVNGIGAKALMRSDGSALAVSSIKSGMILLAVYRAGADEFWCVNIPPSALSVASVTLTGAASVGGNLSVTGVSTLTGNINQGGTRRPDPAGGTLTDGATGDVHSLEAGTIRCPNVGTTASAANVFFSGANNSILKSTSSLRYKRDVRDLTDAEADAVLDLRPVRYKSRASADDQTREFDGFIAEEAALVAPDLVAWSYLPEDVDGDGNPLPGAEPVPDGFQYERVVVRLLSVVQRLSARIAALEA